MTGYLARKSINKKKSVIDRKHYVDDYNMQYYIIHVELYDVQN